MEFKKEIKTGPFAETKLAEVLLKFVDTQKYKNLLKKLSLTKPGEEKQYLKRKLDSVWMATQHLAGAF